MKQSDEIAIRQAESEIRLALQRLERETNRGVRTIIIGEESTFGGHVTRYVRVELAEPPADNWSGA